MIQPALVLVLARAISRIVPAGGRRTGGTNKSLLMSTPILDPSLPADHSPLSSGKMRGQFLAIQNYFDDLRARLIKGRSTKGVAFPAEAR